MISSIYPLELRIKPDKMSFHTKYSCLLLLDNIVFTPSPQAKNNAFKVPKARIYAVGKKKSRRRHAYGGGVQEKRDQGMQCCEDVGE